MTEEHIIRELRQGNSKVLKQVYVHLNTITSYVMKNSGTAEDGHDVFQETVIVFYRNVVKPEFKLTSAIGTYLYAIGRRVWLNKLRANKMKLVDETKVEERALIEAFEFELPEYASPDLGQKLNHLLDQLGETCKEILQLFYFKKLNLEAIKDKLAYGSSQVVRQQKYRCIKKVRDQIAKEPNLI